MICYSCMQACSILKPYKMYTQHILMRALRILCELLLNVSIVNIHQAFVKVNSSLLSCSLDPTFTIRQWSSFVVILNHDATFCLFSTSKTVLKYHQTSFCGRGLGRRLYCSHLMSMQDVSNCLYSQSFPYYCKFFWTRFSSPPNKQIIYNNYNSITSTIGNYFYATSIPSSTYNFPSAL